MVVFGNIDGSLSMIEPQVITQGSNNVQKVVFILDALSNYSSVDITFKLPNDKIIFGGIMLKKEIVFDGKLYNAYTYSLDNNITNFYGALNIGFSINDCNGNKLKTYTAQASIVKTNKPILPEIPNTQWYENITNAFAYLDGKIQELEENKQDKE